MQTEIYFFPFFFIRARNTSKLQGTVGQNLGQGLCKQSLSPNRLRHLCVSSLDPNIVIWTNLYYRLKCRNAIAIFFITEHAFTCLPFHFFKVSLGGSSKPIQHPLLLTVECLEVGQVLAAHCYPGGPRSVTQDSPATPSFLESLAGWWPPFRRARADVAPPRAHQPQPGLTGGVTQVQAGLPPAWWDRRLERAGHTCVKPHCSFSHKSQTRHPANFP